MNKVGQLVVGLILALIAVTGFASTFIFGAALTKNHHVSPMVLACLRYFIAGSVLFVVEVSRAESRRKLFAPRGRDWVKMAWIAPIGTFLMAWAVFKGCALVSAANASMADALTPLMIFVVVALRARRIEPKELFGLICGFIGALLVIQVLTKDGLQLSSYSMGDVYVLLAAATWGVYTAFGRELIKRKRIGCSVFSTWTALIGSGFAALFLPFGTYDWPDSWQAWGLLVGLGLIGTLLPLWTWNAAQKYLPMSVLGVSAYFTPVIAVLLAMAFLDESATLLQWIGTLFIIASAVVETGRTKREGGHR